MKEIILDFVNNDYSDAMVCPDEGLVHQEQMNQIWDIWERLYAETNTGMGCNRCNSYRQYHNTISIFASRGAGKTTFLLSFLERIREQEGVLCLDLMDPSLIEMKQHPFISIIASIHEKVELILGDMSRGNCHSHYGAKFDIAKNYWDCYKQLLKGLPFLDGIGRESVYEDWEDEDFISVQGMAKAKASNKLECAFHTYVKNALQLMGKRCLVIPFDDIDTDFKKGYEILEVIRKYLTCENIIPVITGDLELYGNLVRRAFWQYFELDFLEKETSFSKRSKEDFASLINQLENQYLIKVLKPENRIHLKNLKEYMEDENYHIKIKTCSGKAIKLFDCYRNIIVVIGFGARNYRVSNEIISYLTGLSLRVQIRILTLWNLYEQNINTGDDAISLFASNLFGIFWNDVNQKTSNAKALMSSDSSYTIEMLRFLIYTNSLYKGVHFLPETNDNTLNKALFVIGARFNYLASIHKSLIFDYWIRISYVYNVLEKLGGKLKDDILEEFLKYTQFDADAGLVNSVGLGQAFYEGLLNKTLMNSQKVMPGTIFLGKDSPVAFTGFNHVFSILPMTGVMNDQKEESVFLSLYKLFAVIGELLTFNEKESHYITPEYFQNR